MQNSYATFFLFVFFFFIISGVLIFSYVSGMPDGKLHLVFCDVGQGDGIYIRFPDGSDMIVDAGPGDDMAMCPGKYMGFWDRRIELIALTHPQLDHYGGLQDIIKRYDIDAIILPAIHSNNDSYNNLIGEIQQRNVKTLHVNNGDKIRQHNISKIYQKGSRSEVAIDILWPSKAFISHNSNKAYINDDKHTDSKAYKNVLSDIQVVEGSEDVNNFSLVMKVSFGSFDALLTGDAEVDIVLPLIEGVQEPVEVLKVPHHGSKDAVTASFLNVIKPGLAVLSVGKNNRYGHPDGDVVSLLNEQGIQVKRTDMDGSVEIISDGERWWVK